MLHFLPTDSKKAIQKEYTFRVLSVGLTLSFLFLIFSLALLFPSYFLSDAKERFMIERSEAVARTQNLNDINKAQAEFGILKKNLGEMKPIISEVIPSEVLDTLFVNQTKGIKITQAAYIKETAKGPGVLEVSGISATRDGLVAYAKVLQGQKIFTTVDFPISNLAGEKNISFTMKMTGKF